MKRFYSCIRSAIDTVRKRINTELIKRTLGDYLKVLVLLLDEAAALVVIILVLRFFKVQIPLPITIFIGLLIGALVFIIHKSVIPSFHRRVVTGPEGMIGEKGRVVEPLTPVGVVIVQGEHWKAKAVDGNIEADEDIEVVGLERLTLQVKRGEQ